MKLKKYLVILCVFALVFSLSSPAFAAEEEAIIDLGDGFYMVVTLEQGPITRASNTVSGSKTGKVYSGDTQIGSVTLAAEFDISGSTAKATRGSISGTGMNGWRYDRGSTSSSGNKATGTGYFSSGSTTKTLILTLTCSPSGVIS